MITVQTTYTMAHQQKSAKIWTADWGIACLPVGRPTPVLVVVAISSLARILGECSTIHSPPALFFSLFFFLMWRLARPHLFHSVYQDQSTVAQRAEMTVAKWSLTGVWAHFQIDSNTMPRQWHSPLWLHWVEGVCIFRCNLPPALLAKWPGSFICQCSNEGMEWTPNRSQHTKLTLDKKILPLLLPGFKLTTFQLWVWQWHSYHKAIPAPHSMSRHSVGTYPEMS